MTITRSQGDTTRSTALAAEIAGLGAPCVGCSNCRGLCKALIEAIVIPDLVLGGARG